MSALRALFAAPAGFAAGYLVSGGLRLPVVAYDPVARRAFVATAVTGVQLRYDGDLLWARCGAALAAGAALAVPRDRPFTVGTSAATALALVALDVLYFLSRLLAAT